MSDTTSTPIRTDQLLPQGTKMGPVFLSVTDREKALAIWRDVVGLKLIAEEGNVLRLGTGDDVLIVLETGAARPVAERTTGLYHVAIHVPNRADLARFMVRAIEAGVRIAPTDHLVTEVCYIWDLDGNGIEITFETPWRGRLADPESGSYGITNDGQPHSGREALDIESVLGELEGDSNPRAPMPEGTRIGHVHVHVNSLDDAMYFYRDQIGFGGLFILRNWGMGDAGLGYMPHAIAFNIWAGANAPRKPQDAAGLKHFTMVVPDEAALDAISGRLEKAGTEHAKSQGELAVSDPSGNLLKIYVAG